MPLSHLTDVLPNNLSTLNFPACLKNVFLQMAYFNHISNSTQYIWLPYLFSLFYIFARPISLPSPSQPVSFVYCLINVSRLLGDEILIVLSTKKRNNKKEIYDVIEVLANAVVAVVLQYTHVANQHAVYLELTQCSTSILSQ